MKKATERPQGQLSAEEAARYALDRLFQDLTTTAWPILLSGQKCIIEANFSGIRGDKFKVKVSQFID